MTRSVPGWTPVKRVAPRKAQWSATWPDELISRHPKPLDGWRRWALVIAGLLVGWLIQRFS